MKAQTLSTTLPLPEQAESALPPKGGVLRKLLSHPKFMPYYRLMALVITANLIVGVSVSSISVPFLMSMVLANFAAAILIRQQYVINALFASATSLPLSAPLWLRAAAGKIYHFGGIHVGGFFSGSLWFGLLVAEFVRQGASPAFVAMNFLHLVILVTMGVSALPQFRHKHHNAFEIIARFGSWSSLALFWALHFSLLEGNFWASPGSYVLLVITTSIALPWIRLRKVKSDLESPSNHVALAKFNYGVTPFAGSSTELSRNPLFEWHSFANIPWPDRSGFRLTISRAGDWTGQLIDDLPEKLWVKGIPTAGVGNIEKLFKKVVWVATGSGIGPCLPHLLSGKVPAKLIWSTRSPRETYGDELVNEILEAQPDATIWNTSAHGKPDLVQLAYEAYRDSGAEAVIVISNKKVTFHLNQELESRGIPAYGAIFDS